MPPVNSNDPRTNRNLPSAVVERRSWISRPAGFMLALELALADSRQDGESLAILVLQPDVALSCGGADVASGLESAAEWTNLAKRLRLALGRYTLLARFPDQRFVVLRRELSLVRAAALADRLRVAAELHFLGRPNATTVSAGVACGPIRGNWTPDQLLEFASLGCRHAQIAGGNRNVCSGWPAGR